jgi:hypothetical protein
MWSTRVHIVVDSHAHTHAHMVTFNKLSLYIFTPNNIIPSLIGNVVVVRVSVEVVRWTMVLVVWRLVFRFVVKKVGVVKVDDGDPKGWTKTEQDRQLRLGKDW